MTRLVGLICIGRKDPAAECQKRTLVNSLEIRLTGQMSRYQSSSK
jgi:hypothetical protein